MQNKPQVDFPKIPFSSYDVFGYLIPGLTFIFSVFSFEHYIASKNSIINTLFAIHMPVHTLVFKLYHNEISQNWVLATIYILVVFCMIYVCGHIVSSASSFFIDRVFIYKAYGYPYEILLDLPEQRDEYSVSYYRGLYFWLNLTLVLYYFKYLIFVNSKAFSVLSVSVLIFFVATFTIKIIFSSSFLAPSKKAHKFLQKPRMRSATKPFRFIMKRFYPSFFNLLGNFLSRYLGSRESYDSAFKKKYFDYYKKYFSLDAADSRSNNYWLSLCYIADRSPVLNAMLTNWLHWYSYARNISMAFYCAFIYTYISSMVNFHSLKGALPGQIKIIPLIFLLVSIMMLIRYYYLYMCYYGKFLFRAFVYLNAAEKNPKTASVRKKQAKKEK